MKSYIVDEILPGHMDVLISYMNEIACPSGMKNLYWVDVPEENLTDEQRNHIDCSPHRFAIEVGDNWIKAEFFIRTAKKFKCVCNCCCNDNQRNYIIKYIDTMLSDLNIGT